jgi:Fe-S-cluster containining protein
VEKMGVASIGYGKPCKAHGCTLCCVDTRMSLCDEDVARLRALGFRAKDFVYGYGHRKVLRNVGGHCYFLGDDGCRIYNDRPAGCRLYPLVYDEGRRQGVLDSCCPHRAEFKVGEGDQEALLSLIRKL